MHWADGVNPYLSFAARAATSASGRTATVGSSPVSCREDPASRAVAAWPYEARKQCEVTSASSSSTLSKSPGKLRSDADAGIRPGAPRDRALPGQETSDG